MDYLTLCQTARQRAGMSGAGPAQVTGNSGEMARLVDWVRMAWLDMQAIRTDWRPLWRQLSQAVTVGQPDVTATADMGHPIPERFRFDGAHLRWYAWRDFPAHEVEDGTPVAITRRPDGALMLWPTPDSAGTLTGEYHATPQVLTNDADEPWLPRHLQDGIIHEALVLYGAYEDAPEIVQYHSAKADQFRQRMANELLAVAELGGSLA
jgi:hypothetical protein